MTDAVHRRIVRRHANLGCEVAYKAMVRGMFKEAMSFPGFLSAELITPESPGEEYQIIQRFATESDLERWNASEERMVWLERLRPLTEGEPEYRLLNGLAFFHCLVVSKIHVPMVRFGRSIVTHRAWL
jgi:antibiotic biosynthesis monooxygenase (ABM) superfamily enzyme